MNVRKEPISAEKTLKLVRRAKKAFVKKGQKIIEFDITPRSPSKEEILNHFLGRSGTMRAPVIIVGDTIMAGFDASTYRSMFG